MGRSSRVVVLALMLALGLAPAAPGQTLSKQLAILAPLVGRTWRGEIRAPADGKMIPTEQSYRILGDGSVVKMTTSAPALGAWTEGYFYWDREAGAIATFAIDERGIHTRGTVAMVDSVLTVTGRISFPERSFDFRNTFEFPTKGRMIDRWFQNAFGDWRAGHVVELREAKTE
jgi:hypothetical protein